MKMFTLIKFRIIGKESLWHHTKEPSVADYLLYSQEYYYINNSMSYPVFYHPKLRIKHQIFFSL